MFESDIEKGEPLGDDLARPEIEELPALDDTPENADEYAGDFVEGDYDADYDVESEVEA